MQTITQETTAPTKGLCQFPGFGLMGKIAALTTGQEQFSTGDRVGVDDEGVVGGFTLIQGSGRESGRACAHDTCLYRKHHMTVSIPDVQL